MLFHIVSDKARTLVKQVLQLEEDILTRLPKEKTYTQSPASKVPEPPAAGPGGGCVPHWAWWKAAARGLGIKYKESSPLPRGPWPEWLQVSS